MTFRKFERGGKPRQFRFDDEVCESGQHGNSRPLVDRKTMSLCRVAQKAISFALAGDVRDERLYGLYVESVEPAPDASCLLVTLVPASQEQKIDVADLMERLGHLRGFLRAEVARELCRKRAPNLVFRIGAGTEEYRE